MEGEKISTENEVEIITDEKVTELNETFVEFKKATEKRIQEIVNMKNKGFQDDTIAQKLKVPIDTVRRTYHNFLNESIRNLAEQKNIVAAQNMVYRKRMAEAEEQYEKAKHISENFEGKMNTQAAVAAWHKIVVETADSYTDYLTKIGAISPETYKQFSLEAEIKKEKSPLEILIETNRKQLMEEIKKAKEEENANQPTP